jgi:type I restriction enzyme S subunit
VELRAGYKRTEVGVIPEDWDAVPLEWLTSFISYGFTNPMPMTQAGVYLLTAKDINAGSIQFDTARFTTVHAYQTLLTDKSRPKRGDVLLTKDGTLGRLAVVDERTVCINQSVAILRPNARVVPEFLKALLGAPAYQARMLDDAGGSTIKHIYITVVNRMPLGIPAARHEQQAIATALTDADALITALTQLIAKKRDLKQGAMQELLTGRRRLPGFHALWEDIKLGELGACYRGVTYDPGSDLAAADGPTTIRLLRSNNVQQASLALVDMQYVNVTKVSPVQHLRLLDVLICMANGSRDLVGKAAQFVVDDGHRYTFGAFMGCFRPDERLCDPSFAFQLFQTDQFRKHIAVLLAGSSINNLNPSSVEAFCMKGPRSVAEQTAIATVLSDLDAELAALEARLAKARMLKQGMMQELLTGRIRLV